MTSTLSDFLVPEAVCLGVDAESAEQAIRQVAGRLLEAGYVCDTFSEAVLDRERTIPTGLPLSGRYHAAIPHTDVEHVKKAGIGMATLIRPVVFKNMVSPEEPVDVRLVFVLALDQPKSQIEMLQEVAQVLQRPEVVDALMQAANLAEVYGALKASLPEKS